MDIDILFTDQGEAGLVANGNFVKKAIGIVFDPKTGIMTFEYADSDYMECNIHIETDYHEMLDANAQIHIGAIKNGNIAQAYQVPLMFLDDPYRGEMMRNIRQPANPLQAFNHFVKRATTGQPIHRDDLGNEETMGCILGDAVPTSLKFAPHLARRAAMEHGPRVPTNAPRYGGPSGPGLGGGGGGGGTYYPTNRDDEDQ